MQRIGYLLDGHHVRCHRCLTDGYRLHEQRVMESQLPIALYRESVGAYRQTCHVCRLVLAEGQPSWPELFIDRTKARVQLWQVIVFGVTTKSDGWESTTGAPMFYVYAYDADHAWRITKDVVSQGRNITMISATVCIATILPNGHIETDGEGYKSFVEEFTTPPPRRKSTCHDKFRHGEDCECDER